jgi:AraC-like DNA-binding protein
MLCGSVYTFLNLFKEFGLLSSYQWLYTFNFALLLLACPQVYFYIRSLAISKVRDKYFAFHFVPSLFMLIVGSFIYYHLDEATRFNYIEGMLLSCNSDDLNLKLSCIFFLSFKLIFIIQILLYFIASWKLLIRHQSELNNVFSNFSGYELNWVKFFLWTILIMGIIGVLAYNQTIGLILSYHWIKYLINFINCGVLLSVYLLASMQKNNIYKLEQTESEINPDFDFNNHKLHKKLINCFENEEIYLKHDLSIWDLCRSLNSNRTYVSNLINEEFGMNFNSFVNKYRVNKAKMLLLDNNNQNYSLGKIAELSGFNSITSFNRAFQKFEGINPGSFRNR